MTPQEWETARAADRRGWGAWSHESQQTSVVIERLDWLIYVTQLAAGAKSVPKPRPQLRPGVFDEGKADTYQAAITQAYAQYALEHSGAYPPPGWDHGVDPADHGL